MTLYGVYGASGSGREVVAMLDQEEWADRELVFIDDAAIAEPVNGYACLTWDEFKAAASGREAQVCIAIANATIRERLAKQCADAGIGFFTARSKHAIVMKDIQLGEGAILYPFITLTCNIKAGSHFHTNTFCSVAHDCVIGDFVTFAPGVRCNGNVHIEDHAYIGSGAVIRQGTPEKPLVIGRGAIVGMGAVVTKDVPAGTTVIGNPARPLERR